MSTTALSTIRIDKKTRQQAQIVARNLKTTVNSVVRDFLKQFIVTKGKNYTFSDKGILTPTPYLQKILERSKKNRHLDSPTFTNAKDAIAYLHKKTE